ncbi:hypothetical protein DINM_000390 [Dirofilaria immitis]|nr:hypothetical protein [Dirofilaria immitis]
MGGSIYVFGHSSCDLEIMETVSAEQFVEAFRRFTGRRNKPKHIFFDNVKNFISASKILVELNAAESEKMEWEFITPEFEENQKLMSWCCCKEIVSDREQGLDNRWLRKIERTRELIIPLFLTIIAGHISHVRIYCLIRRTVPSPTHESTEHQSRYEECASARWLDIFIERSLNLFSYVVVIKII